MVLFIDFQGDYVNGRFYIKELAMMTAQARVAHYLFQPVQDYRALTWYERKQVQYSTSQHHQIPWCDGFVDLRHLPRILSKHTARQRFIYVKGYAKVKILEEFGIHARNLETLGGEFQAERFEKRWNLLFGT